MTPPSQNRDDQKPEQAPRAEGRASVEGADEKPRAGRDLRQRLRTAAGSELLDLVISNGGRLGLAEVRQLLLNANITTEIIDELALDRRLTSAYEVKVAIARHARTAEHQALRLVPAIRWRDLLEIALDIRIRAGVRRAAERYLSERLPRLTVGEKIALARRAPPGLAARLGSEANLRILEAMLDNGRLTEEALVTVITDRRMTPRHLDRIANHPRWSVRYDVKTALCRNPKTPLRFVSAALADLARPDLEAVAANRDHSELVRGWAEGILEGMPSSDGREEAIAIDSAEP